MNTPDLMSEFLCKLGSAVAIAAGFITVIGSFYLFNAMTKAWNRRNRPPVGTLRLNPYPGDKAMPLVCDIHLSKGRVLKNLRPLGVVAPEASEAVPGVPSGLFAYMDCSGCWVLVNPGSVQAIVPSADMSPSQK